MSTSSQHMTSLRSFLIPNTGLKCQCDVCGKTLAKKSNLTRHFRKVHGIDPFPKNPKHKCDYCQQQFNNLNQLRYHQRKEHLRIEENDRGCLSQNSETDLVRMIEGESVKEEQNTKSSDVKRHECPLCNESFCRPDFPSHFENKHKLHLHVETLEFDSFSDFMEWKAYMEDETQSNYYKERTSKYGQMNYHYFICNRSGSYKAKGLGVKYLKGQGSSKMNAYCPSSIRVQERKDGNCLVTYQKIHVGHKQDLSSLYPSIPSVQKADANVKTSTNLPQDNILDNAHGDSLPENDIKNLNFQTRKDLHESEDYYLDHYQSGMFNSSFKRKAYLDETQNKYSETNTRGNESHFNLSGFIDEDSESLTVVDDDSESITVMDEDSESVTVIDEDSKSFTAVDEDSESFKSGNEGFATSLPDRDENLIREFVEIVKYASTSEEYDVIEKTLISLKSKVKAARSSAFSMHFSVEKTVRHESMSYQENMFFKNQRLKCDNLIEPSFIQSQNVALSLVLNNGN